MPNMNMSLSWLRVNNDDDFDEKFDKNVTVNVPPAMLQTLNINTGYSLMQSILTSKPNGFI